VNKNRKRHPEAVWTERVSKDDELPSPRRRWVADFSRCGEMDVGTFLDTRLVLAITVP
jgi:hypothetical protein